MLMCITDTFHIFVNIYLVKLVALKLKHGDPSVKEPRLALKQTSKQMLMLKLALKRVLKLISYICKTKDSELGDGSNTEDMTPLIMNDNERPFECMYCEKRFQWKQNMEQHLRNHMGDEPFQCSYCSKRFDWKHNLTTHLRVHTGERPFKCTICDKQFTQKKGI
ncbi:gastrula zinc finger protein XlCGF49.1-like [Penaeus monodon]|uniref:gastrula zinc finger protein XlCGF49.1-like n=1 Tax=Penaeus monodon TaxID=6687 RepID=UPI0018A6DA0B|nr:gastrula zinc finger protein XlCGF49.1-like [Penaeus monodon]